MDASDPRLGGVRPSALPTDRALAMTVGGEDAVMFANVFPKTAVGQGRARLELPRRRSTTSGCPSYRPYDTPYPLLLVSPASDRRITSTFGNLPVERRRAARSRCIPTTRGRVASSTAMRVVVWNDLGEVHLPLAITDAVRPGRGVARSRARGSRRATTARRSPRSRPATTPTSPGAPATTTRASRWPPTNRVGDLLPAGPPAGARRKVPRRGARLPELVGDLLPVADGHGDREERGM